MADYRKNLASGIVATAPSPATTGTTMTLQTGYGQTMPSTPFFLTVSPSGQLSTALNSEIVLVTARTNDTLTIVRAQKGTSAKPIDSGWIVANGSYIEANMAVGDIAITLNAAPQAGRVFMAGQTLNKSDYPLLYDHVVNNPGYGTTTSTTFTLKDMRSRVPAGKSASGTFNTLGATGGAESVSMTHDMLVGHWHSILLSTAHGDGEYVNDEALAAPLQWTGRRRYRSGTGKAPSHSNFSGNDEVNGSQRSTPVTPMPNLQPYIVINFEVIAG